MKNKKYNNKSFSDGNEKLKKRLFKDNNIQDVMTTFKNV